jgi:DnaK suppressor protein
MPAAKRPTPAAPLPVAGTPLTARAGARHAKSAAARPLTSEATTQLARLQAEEVRLETLLETAPELPEISAGGDDVHLVAEALVADNAQKAFYVRQLEDVRTSMSAIARGSYGTCTGCGQPIPAARLEVMPDATKCVPCASGRR